MSLKNDAPEEHDNVKYITLMGWKNVSNLDLCALISAPPLPITSSTVPESITDALFASK
jgi:hypothetical protein